MKVIIEAEKDVSWEKKEYTDYCDCSDCGDSCDSSSCFNAC